MLMQLIIDDLAQSGVVRPAVLQHLRVFEAGHGARRKRPVEGLIFLRQHVGKVKVVVGDRYRCGMGMWDRNVCDEVFLSPTMCHGVMPPEVSCRGKNDRAIRAAGSRPDGPPESVMRR